MSARTPEMLAAELGYSRAQIYVMLRRNEIGYVRRPGGHIRILQNSRPEQNETRPLGAEMRHNSLILLAGGPGFEPASRKSSTRESLIAPPHSSPNVRRTHEELGRVSRPAGVFRCSAVVAASFTLLGPPPTETPSGRLARLDHTGREGLGE